MVPRYYVQQAKNSSKGRAAAIEEKVKELSHIWQRIIARIIINTYKETCIHTDNISTNSKHMNM